MTDTGSYYLNREQSEIKHYALRLYLEAAARILGNKRNLRYIDCCAGPWNACSGDYCDTSFGIAVSTLRKAKSDLSDRGLTPRMAALLIEKCAEVFLELQCFAQKNDSADFRVHARNWDFTEHVADIVRYCSSPDTFSFIFIDPTGWQLAGISKIRSLLQLNPGEVLINLMSPFISRFIKDNKTDFSDLLGEDFPSLRRLSGSALESAIVDKYCELIGREGGFEYVCSLPVMNPDLDSFNFHLVYATRHQKGVEVFKSVERRTEEKTHIIRAEIQRRDREQKSGNFELFGPDVLYRENCYQRLATDHKERARASVWNLIETVPGVAYDACWGTALQHSAVYESDLREWIEAWSRAGAVTVEGKSSRARVLQVGKGIRIHRNGHPGKGRTLPRVVGRSHPL
jgi:three-Cys-motif partner protein